MYNTISLWCRVTACILIYSKKKIIQNSNCIKFLNFVRKHQQYAFDTSYIILQFLSSNFENVACSIMLVSRAIVKYFRVRGKHYFQQIKKQMIILTITITIVKTKFFNLLICKFYSGVSYIFKKDIVIIKNGRRHNFSIVQIKST